MAQPSSSHRERDDHRRERSSSHRSHRSISSTTLLLVLSLILAVLAVMLSLPNAQSVTTPTASKDANGNGLLQLLAPKRSEALVTRESAVAAREAEVARREAEILVGAPGGVVQPPVVCPVCPSVAVSETTVTAPVQTVIKEVVKEIDALTAPGWWKEAGIRVEDILAREQKIAEREKEISRREEAVNRREHDASRREGWIMEQLVALGNEPNVVEEEYVYEPAGAKRKAKELPPLILTATQTVTEHLTHTLSTATVTLPSPANTRFAPSPAPQKVEQPSTASSPRTTAIEVVVEDELVDDDVDLKTVTMKRSSGKPNSRRPPSRWWGGW